MTFKTLITAAATATLLMTTNALAEVSVSNAWARASAGMANAGATFLMLKNNGAIDDTLVAAKGNIAKRIELHTHTMEGGVMKMREVEGGIPVPANGMQMLQPGGYHVMLMGLKAPLKQGTSFPLTLIFSNGQETTIDVQVKSPSAMGAMDHSKMDMGKGMDKGMDHGKKMGH